MTRGGRTVRALVWLLVVALGGCEHELWLTTHGAVDDGNQALAEGNIDEAIRAYEEAAGELPESPDLDYDRGVALSAAGRHDEATQRLLRALETVDPELRFKVLAALGAAYGCWALEIERSGQAAPPEDGAEPEAEVDPAEAALSKWDRSVDHLEAALALKPSDEAALRNLEIALLRVDPPCSTRDDEHEENDTAATAAAVELAAPEAPPQSTPEPQAPQAIADHTEWKRQLTACPDDSDWFRLDLEAGDRLTAKLVTPSDGGRLGLSLHGAGGAPQLRPPAGADVVLDTLDYSVGAQGGPHLLHVANLDGDEVGYSLDLQVRPACARTEDPFEENDTPALAAPLTPGAIDNLKICPLDEDWYSLVLAEGESVFVFVSLMEEDDAGKDKSEEPDEGGAPPPPPIFVDFVAEDGSIVSKGAPAGQARVATLLTPGEGTYRMRVHGEPDLEARYQLVVQIVGPCPEGDDQLEDNDGPEDAADFVAAAQAQAQAQGGAGGGGMAPQAAQGPPPPMLLRICPGDVDWLKFQAEPEKPVVISAVFEHAKGDLALALFDEIGQELVVEADASSEAANGEAVALPEVEVPTYYSLRVQGATPEAENFYLLRVDQPSGGGGDSGDQDENEDEEQEQEQEQEPDQGDQEPEPEPQPQPEQEQEQTPLEDALDKLDHNPENLEATRAQGSPLANHPPEKDW